MAYRSYGVTNFGQSGTNRAGWCPLGKEGNFRVTQSSSFLEEKLKAIYTWRKRHQRQVCGFQLTLEPSFCSCNNQPLKVLSPKKQNQRAKWNPP